MFNNIPQSILDRMHYLEQLDAEDRIDGTPRMKRLRQISAETGRFLALLALTAPDGDYIEIGTSAGYSTLWLSLAARQAGRKIKTFEVDESKIELAGETFKLAEVENEVELINGDFRTFPPQQEAVSFCFLDSEKEDYQDFYEAIISIIVPGGILVADNVISHKDDLAPMIDRVLNDKRVDATIVPIGRGELLCRKK
jgi:predicted O-methyltransferase YrrM